MKRLIEQGVPSECWSEGYRTPLVNALDLFQKIGKQREPKVIELMQQLTQGSQWERLLPQEQDFIRNYCL